MVPTEDDEQEAREWAKETGGDAPNAWEIAKDQQLQRAVERGVTLPADYERAVFDYRQQSARRASDLLSEYRGYLDILERGGEDALEREEPLFYERAEQALMMGDDIGDWLQRSVDTLGPQASDGAPLTEQVYRNVSSKVDRDRHARKWEVFNDWDRD